ncbi:flavin reductase [Longispora fulva]|uniref:Flavin reductase (DIM6/NTAB) family NADH-FMN oxidoreductase RutF n=1 Tax=Longispora fulva TaxID=619741 RepID=A0A8J7GC43_9ACTN|nr:flavin reductase family protein [Longispora fulva]MBG6134846.1 flavin reductase (DIM6/NTAB) family NADH-FMN oxidoreductase RutF [Longispora fulva]GIG56922.1 flavin reductase [Longispora fulva]
MHKVTDLKVHYYGTPVVLISSRNPDGTANIAPMSSAWWLGQACMLGLGNSSQTAANLLREGGCVLNLAPSTLVDAVDRLAMTTGTPDVPPGKAAQGYRHEPDKFGVAGLTAQPSDLVGAPRIAECPIQLECEVVAAHPFGMPEPRATAFHVLIRRAHVEESLIIPGTAYVDPIGWDPLIMKFCEFFGGGDNVHPSRLAEGWNMPHQLPQPA